MTLAAFYDACGPLVIEGLTSNTAASYERAWRIRVAPSLGTVPVAELTPLRIARARSAWDGSASTKQDAMSVLSRLLDLAMLDGLILTNPCASLPRSRRKAHDPDPVARALSDEQVATMLDLTAFHPFGQRALAGLAFTGLRLGELAGMRWEDIDLARGLLTVRRTLSPDGHGRMESRPTKSGRVRSVPLLDELLPWLAGASAAGFEYVFTGVRGGPFDHGNLARALRWAQLRDRIATFADGRPLTFHDLRHTYLTRLTRLGVSPANVQRVAGHASITTTELYTRSSSTEAALAVGEHVNRLSREVTREGVNGPRVPRHSNDFRE